MWQEKQQPCHGYNCAVIVKQVLMPDFNIRVYLKPYIYFIKYPFLQCIYNNMVYLTLVLVSTRRMNGEALQQLFCSSNSYDSYASSTSIYWNYIEIFIFIEVSIRFQWTLLVFLKINIILWKLLGLIFNALGYMVKIEDDCDFVFRDCSALFASIQLVRMSARFGL